MKIIPISGVIGSADVQPAGIRAQLDAARGEDVEVQISSPGGLILAALEIYNLIHNYQGRKTARLMGEAASAASYIAMAADYVRGEDNLVYMLHNAQGGALGDHNTMRKAADVLDGLSGIMAQAYARKTGKSVDAIRAIMDDEGWYFGAEAKEAGFVDEIVSATTDAPRNKPAALAAARAAVALSSAKARSLWPADGIEKAAAMLGGITAGAPGVMDAQHMAAALKAKYGGGSSASPDSSFSPRARALLLRMNFTEQDIDKMEREAAAELAAQDQYRLDR